MEENSSQCVYRWPRRRETDNASFLATMYSWSTGTVSTRELTTDKCPAIPTGKISTARKETLSSNMKTIAPDMLTKSVPSSPFYHFFGRVTKPLNPTSFVACWTLLEGANRIYRVYVLIQDVEHGSTEIAHGKLGCRHLNLLSVLWFHAQVIGQKALV